MLILDQNISYKVAKHLADIFMGICHVSDVGLLNASDRKIWEYARQNKLTIITSDNDFLNFSLLYGNPPKIILLKTGNRKTRDLSDFLAGKRDIIFEFVNSESFVNVSCLELH